MRPEDFMLSAQAGSAEACSAARVRIVESLEMIQHACATLGLASATKCQNEQLSDRQNEPRRQESRGENEAATRSFTTEPTALAPPIDNSGGTTGGDWIDVAAELTELRDERSRVEDEEVDYSTSMALEGACIIDDHY